jgi:hypothetical protein
MGIPNRTENVIYNVVGTIFNLSIFEELDGVRNQATFSHTKQVIQWLEATLAF